jgi:hypothetical protein
MKHPKEIKTKRPPKRSEKKMKYSTINTKDEKMWNYTEDEMMAIPSRIFPHFSDLAEELQSLIWTCVLSQQTIIECVYRSDLKRFWAFGSKTAIHDTAIPDPAMRLVRPLYMMPCITVKHWEREFAQDWEQGWQPEWGPRRKNKKHVRFRSAEPIYMHPQKDIIYLPDIHSMDVDTFINQESSHAIENLAVHSSVALELNKARFWALFDASPAGKLIRGLPNLKTLHIIEGEYTGSEASIKQGGQQRLSLVGVKEGEDTAIKYSSGAARHKIKHPWNSGVAESIRKIFIERILVEDAIEQYKKYQPGWKWNVPELQFHELKREVIEE